MQNDIKTLLWNFPRIFHPKHQTKQDEDKDNFTLVFLDLMMMLLFSPVWKGKIYEKGNSGARKVPHLWTPSPSVNLKQSVFVSFTYPWSKLMIFIA